MKTYRDIFNDFCNTTRLNFRSFAVLIQERKKQEEEVLKQFFQKISTKVFDKFKR